MEIEAGDGGYRIIETIELPARWAWALLLGILFALFWIYTPVPLVFATFCVALFLSFLLLAVLVPSPLNSHLQAPDNQSDTNDDGDSSEQGFEISPIAPSTFKTSCVGPPGIALCAGLVAAGPVFASGIPLLLEEVAASSVATVGTLDTWLLLLAVGLVWVGGFWATTAIAGVLIHTYEDATVRIRVFPFDALRRLSLPLPELTGGYLLLIALAGLPIVALTESYFLLPFLHHFPNLTLSLHFLVPPFLVVCAIVCFLYWWTVPNRRYVYERTIDQLGGLDSWRRRALAGALTIGSSYGLAWMLLRFGHKYRSYLYLPVFNGNLLPFIEYWPLVVLLSVSAVPALYFLAGIWYQVIAQSLLLATQFARSRPIGQTLETGATIRLVEPPSGDSRQFDAYALSVGIRDVIFLSADLWEVLDGRQLDAIIAHEEGHIEHGDALLGPLIPFAGLCTLTGQSLLYALLNFRQREIDADEYAAKAVGDAALGAALGRLDELTGSLPGGVSVAFLPQINLARRAPLLERWFGLLFGSYTLTNAHPSIGERLDRLNGADTTDDSADTPDN